MTSDRVLDRLRDANPVPAAALTDDGLLARIVAGPRDRRLATPVGTARRRWLRLRARQLALLGVSVVLGAAGGTVGAIKLGVISHASPKELFHANPAGLWPGSARQKVVPGTVRRATTFTVPGVGRFEWWIAISTKGWLCDAIRQPDGTWAGLAGDRFEVSGATPGCSKFPWHDSLGFAYDQTSVPSPDGQIWRVVYGYVPTTGDPAEVRDRISGASAVVGDGRYFAIVMPLCRGRCHYTSGPPPNLSGPLVPGYRLQTLARDGRVLVTDRFDPGM
jgi:hypothetical protein